MFTSSNGKDIPPATTPGNLNETWLTPPLSWIHIKENTISCRIRRTITIKQKSTAMENTDQHLSTSPTPVSPSTSDKENHPPPFTNFHTWDILYYFNAEFGTFDQYSKYLQHHLSNWQQDPHFQHFPSLYVQYCTFNDHIDSLGKILKTMEKSWDSIKGTIQYLTPLLHKKGLQDSIISITNL